MYTTEFDKTDYLEQFSFIFFTFLHSLTLFQLAHHKQNSLLRWLIIMPAVKIYVFNFLLV